ncbi:gephyrin-like molybdotransferase Glp [Phaeobacter sp. B1627]|uniref:molybdopterin molybdotransferase MoeA n=1 Tax=Phaeobacter sp. B1627 TaxID=2583809 RepID=UPI001119F011|nr:gephyrin-like molybdotransferase Glp [Phaeobacter sp. B1627]TNJ46787.1 molybdopterin molybdotransferase MoeA [Phaeobacter sp. B1627]
MIPVAEARAALLHLVSPTGIETVPLAEAAGRVLAQSVIARRDQPPFDASAMDGYAVNAAEVEQHAMFKVIGEAAAGHGYPGRVGAGQAVRIFTGAPVPEGASYVVIQEDVSRTGDLITLVDAPDGATHIRPLGSDFSVGQEVSAPHLLRAADVALLAAMNIAEVPVRRRPVVALMSTGDELVMPGDTPGPDQIIVSNTFGLKAMLDSHGAEVRMLPIARDTKSSLRQAFDFAGDADLVVTIGGASVGDHDLVAAVAQELGLERSFYKVAMRPGKPLMAGRFRHGAMVGLPGNPVSAMVCGRLFVVPMVRALLGLPSDPDAMSRAPLAIALPENGPRAHYMRGFWSNGALQPFDSQDSSLLSVLAQAEALILRPPHAPAANPGDTVEYLTL